MKTLKHLLLIFSCVLFLFLTYCNKDEESINDPGGNGTITLPTPEINNVVDFYGGLNIQWTPVDGASSYNLYWTDDNTEPDLASNKISNLTGHVYFHTGLDYSKVYKYKLQAVSGNNVSALSATANGSPMMPSLEAPKNVSASGVTNGIRITWDAVSGDNIVYGVKRRVPATESTYRIIAENINVTEYIDQNIQIGMGYFYKVYAFESSTNRTSSDSDPAYTAKRKVINETERNNQNITNTLSYNTHYYDAETSTEDFDWFRIKGGYTGQYRIYSSGFYKSFEADCFLLTLNQGDRVEFTLISGDMSGLWGMTAEVREWGKYSNGNDRELISHSFAYSGDSFTYNKTSTGTVFGTYLQITMWEDLINYGPYNYEIEIKITR